jgi:hypothetical protein
LIVKQSAATLPKKEVSIDGTTYELYMLNAKKGSYLLAKIVSSLGLSVTSLSGFLSESKETSAVAFLGSVLRALTPELLEEVTDVFALHSNVFRDGAKPRVKDVFDFHFAGHYGHMANWLIECLKYNYSDFLAVARESANSGSEGTSSSSSPPTG